MITHLDHIAIAVPDLQAAIDRFVQDLGLEFNGTEDVPSARTTTAFLPVPGTRIELVHPLHGEGPIARFLSKRGGGIHHLCFATDDLDADVTKLRDRGYRFTSDAPMPGAHGTRVMFIHPSCFDGVLIELAEHPHAPADATP